MNIPGYDAWKTSGPDETTEVGTEEGQPCNRVEEPDEDAPRGYKPKPCKGVIVHSHPENCSCHLNAPCSSCVDSGVECDTCGWTDSTQQYIPREEYYKEEQEYFKKKRGTRGDETTTTHTANPFNSTPFTVCCEVAAVNTSRCPHCLAQITYHDDGLAARRREVGHGNCLMCGKKRGPLGIPGNCCC